LPAVIYAGFVKAIIAAMASLVWLIVATTASAQAIPPLAVTGPAQSVIPQLRPPSPIEQVRESAMRRSPPLPLPPPPAERWVPEQRVYAPEVGRNLVIPGHYERRISDQQYAVPPLPAYDVNSGTMVVLPATQRPPADLRQGP
jgi:hypothetical protein